MTSVTLAGCQEIYILLVGVWEGVAVPNPIDLTLGNSNKKNNNNPWRDQAFLLSFWLAQVSGFVFSNSVDLNKDA